MRSLRYLLTRRRAPRTRTVLAAALAAAIVGVAFVPAAAGASPVINTTTDRSLGDCSVTCSLRDAVALSSPGDTLTVPAGHYVLTLGRIEISITLTLAGSGARTTTIDGGGSSSIFLVDAAAGNAVSISDLSLVNAAGAGAITAQGPSAASPQTLNLLRMTIANNQSTGNGGGVAANFTNLSIDSCTFSNDQAGGSGGGIFASNATTTIVNSTITGNTAGSPGSGVAFIDSPTHLTNDTVAANLSLPGPGLELLGGSFTVTDTIIANNVGGDCVIGVSSDQGFGGGLSQTNLDTDNSCFFGDPGSPAVDPRLGPLANNGGPTDTMALLAGSPAVNHGAPSPACEPTDQRGVTRPQGFACDIGAYEDTLVSITVDNPTVTVNEGQTATNTGKVHDADGDPITLIASFGTVVNNGDGTWSWSASFNEPAQGFVQIIAETDDGFNLASAVVFQLVFKDVPPSVFSVTNSGPIVAPGSATITVNAGDVTGGNDTLFYAFDCNGDGIFEVPFQPSNTTTCSFSTPGNHTVNVVVTDGEGGFTTGSTVVVATANCSNAVASPNLLWPPNHKMVPIQISGVTSAGGGAVSIVVTSIFQDEPVTDGPDATGLGTATPSVRAERDGGGDGRVYHISFNATTNGASCTGSVTVGVPHDQGQHSTPIDEGSLYDSTLP